MKIVIIICFIYFTFTLFSLPPTVTVGDTAELTGVAVNYGIAHSPGYPLFVNVYKLFSFILPFGNYGYRLNIASLLFGCLTIVVLYFTIYRITQEKFSSIVTVLYFISSEPIIRQNQVSEVFSLNNFIIIIILFILISTNFPVEKKLYITSFLFGLGLGNQHIILLFLPAIFYWVITNYHFSAEERYIKNIKPFLFTLLFFILGLSIYLYVPLRSVVQPLYDWEDPESLDRFLYLFRRGRYGTLSLAQGGKISFNIENIISGIRIFFFILGIPGTVVFILSCIPLIFYRTKFLFHIILCLLGWYFSGPFLITISGLKIPTPQTVYILERLTAHSIIFVSLIIGLTVKLIFENQSLGKYLLKYVILCLLLYLSGVNLNKNFFRNDFFSYDYTVNIFRNTPYNSIILSDRADETEFWVTYFQRIEKIRPEIEFIDCNASVSRSIYGDNYYFIWGKPRLEIRNKVEKELIISAKKQVFYSTVLPEQTSTQKFKYGLLYSVNPEEKGTEFSEYFVFRDKDFSHPRVQGLYFTYLDLLGKYYFDLAVSNEKFSSFMKDHFYKLFLLTGSPRYYMYIPYYYFVKGKLDIAENEYRKLLNYSLSPDIKKEVYLNLGVIYENKNIFNVAEKFYNEAIKIDPEYELAYINLGVVYWKTNRYVHSLKMFEKVLTLNPSNTDVKNYIKRIKNKL